VTRLSGQETLSVWPGARLENNCVSRFTSFNLVFAEALQLAVYFRCLALVREFPCPSFPRDKAVGGVLPAPSTCIVNHACSPFLPPCVAQSTLEGLKCAAHTWQGGTPPRSACHKPESADDQGRAVLWGAIETSAREWIDPYALALQSNNYFRLVGCRSGGGCQAMPGRRGQEW